MLLQITERRIEPDIIVVELTGKLALGRESQKIETVVDHILEQGTRAAIFEMTALDYIDSAGIGLLALAAGKLKQSGGRLAVVAREGRVLQMLRMTRMTDIMSVTSTLSEAVAAAGGAQQASA
jgi:anti-sigma B factor antagonist